MSAIRLLVLGTIVRRKVSHGYRVYQDLIAWRAETWTSVKRGSIYHALEKLESQGMITAVRSEDSSKLGPSKTEYILTENGELEFLSLLESALKSNDFQLVAAGIAFMEFFPRQRVIKLLEERLISLQEVETFLHSLPIESIPSDPSKHPELVGMWVGYFEYARKTTQNLIQSLQSGNYLFQGEEREKE